MWSSGKTQTGKELSFSIWHIILTCNMKHDPWQMPIVFLVPITKEQSEVGSIAPPALLSFWNM